MSPVNLEKVVNEIKEELKGDNITVSKATIRDTIQEIIDEKGVVDINNVEVLKADIINTVMNKIDERLEKKGKGKDNASKENGDGDESGDESGDGDGDETGDDIFSLVR